MTNSEKKLLAVPLATLVTDSVTDFDLYLDTADATVLYRKRDLPFTDDIRQRLLDHRVEALLIERRQEGAYRRYVERNLSQLLSDDSIGINDKSELLYESASGLMEDVLANPQSGDVIPRSRALVEGSLNHLLHHKDAFSGLVKVLSYDYYTYTHSVNVFTYTMALCQRMGVHDRGVLQEIGEGALLHDVGKSLLDPAIINSTKALTREQWAAMKQHPVHSAEILAEQGSTSAVTLDIARHHHEKMDGSGYPDGLAGDAISSYVRISTVADIFDALTTKRSYKGASQSFDALGLMKAEMREELDQEVFSAFVDLMGHPDEA